MVALFSGISAIIALSAGGIAGYKIGHHFGHSDGVSDQKATQAQEALVASNKASTARRRIENETAKLKAPDIDSALSNAGWMRSSEDL